MSSEPDKPVNTETAEDTSSDVLLEAQRTEAKWDKFLEEQRIKRVQQAS